MQVKSKSMSDAQVDEAARLFGILSDSSRLKLLRALMSAPLTVSELIEVTGMKQGNVSKHLGVLLAARFVAREREGNFARYSLADPRLYELCDLMCMRIADDAKTRIKQLAS
jgi:DNA-binding transcriptional ArsR family regulator